MELRRYVARLLDWEDAHVSFDAAVEGIGPPHRGRTPTGLPHSPWQLLEHLRITQRDILDFCREPKYIERRWPEDLNLFQFVDSPTQALRLLQERLGSQTKTAAPAFAGSATPEHPAPNPKRRHP